MLSRMMTRREQLLLFGAGLAFVLGSLSLYLHQEVWKTPSPEASSPAAPGASVTGKKTAPRPSKARSVHATGTAEGEGEPQWITVKDVVEPVVGVAAMGEVYQPGFYYMAEDARVIDLIERAGGANRRCRSGCFKPGSATYRWYDPYRAATGATAYRKRRSALPENPPKQEAQSAVLSSITAQRLQAGSAPRNIIWFLPLFKERFRKYRNSLYCFL